MSNVRRRYINLLTHLLELVNEELQLEDFKGVDVVEGDGLLATAVQP